MHCKCFVQDPVAFFRKVKEDTGIDFLASGSGSRMFGGGGGRGESGRGGRGPSLDYRPAPPVAFETYGLSHAFLRTLNIEGPLCNRVFVANVSYLRRKTFYVRVQAFLFMLFKRLGFC